MFIDVFVIRLLHWPFLISILIQKNIILFCTQVPAFHVIFINIFSIISSYIVLHFRPYKYKLSVTQRAIELHQGSCLRDGIRNEVIGHRFSQAYQFVEVLKCRTRTYQRNVECAPRRWTDGLINQAIRPRFQGASRFQPRPLEVCTSTVGTRTVSISVQFSLLKLLPVTLLLKQ